MFLCMLVLARDTNNRTLHGAGPLSLKQATRPKQGAIGRGRGNAKVVEAGGDHDAKRFG